jgi:hypothetical protein
MKKFIVIVSDVAEYSIEASSAAEAKAIAWDWFTERKPAFEVEEVEENETL